MVYTIKEIALILKSREKPETEALIEQLLLDSRRLIFPATTLFFALKGLRRDGHTYIQELYDRGVRHFVVSQPVDSTTMPEAIFLTVSDTLTALQALVAFHRKKFSIPVVGITGSNGKTIVKEWLYQLLHEQYQIIRSPKSYNSQIGVPLSVWPMNETHQLGLFEAGISQSGEMEKLQKIIQPTIGLFTNIGEAHSEGFLNIRQKVNEKLRLFTDVHTLIYRKDDTEVHEAVAAFWQQLHRSGKTVTLVNWSTVSEAALQILTLYKEEGITQITGSWKNATIEIRIPFTDEASIENAIHCWCLMLHLGIRHDLIERRMRNLEPVAMRLELKQGIHHCLLINDSYSNDINSLKIALDFLSQQSHHKQRTVILSDIPQSSKPEKELYQEVASLLAQHQVKRFIGVGERLSFFQPVFRSVAGMASFFYNDAVSLIKDVAQFHFKEETILLKGARRFALESINQLLEQHQHETVLEINLTALVNNLKRYQEQLHPGTKIMAMVKAFAYGTGSFDIARALQFHKVDYLAVAYADEGVELREAGIWLPIMVMNPEATAYELIVQHHLEPVLYSPDTARAFEQFLNSQGLQHYPVHIEVETGMHRLGFNRDQLEAMAPNLKAGIFKVQSAFTHLVASEDVQSDPFTRKQAAAFQEYSDLLEQAVGYSFLRHIANTAAITRHPDLHLDMVRLGIGLYGGDNRLSGLQQVSSLRTTIAQIKDLKKGDTVGYNRLGKITRDARVATIRIGYADGYPRSMGNGAGFVMVSGKKAPVIGSVCMDMTMIDITDIPDVQEGDDVLLFGEGLSVQELAKVAGTIPYDIISGIAQRVKRVYIEE